MIYNLNDPLHKRKTKKELTKQAKASCQTAYKGSLKEEKTFYQK